MTTSKEYRHVFFDLDNTLTRSRSKVTPAMRALLAGLPKTIAVISGARTEQIRFQLDDLPCFVLGQNGNHAMHGDTELWHDLLAEDEKAAILAHIKSLPRTWSVPDLNDLIEDRGCQITYSLYGHHAPVPDKERFDPDQAIRKRLLAARPLVSETIDVKIAGTTGLDYFKKGRDKGYNCARLMADQGWEQDTCVYFGDMLFPGGNDESVIGVMDTVQVKDPSDTYERLMLLRSQEGE